MSRFRTAWDLLTWWTKPRPADLGDELDQADECHLADELGDDEQPAGDEHQAEPEAQQPPAVPADDWDAVFRF